MCTHQSTWVSPGTGLGLEKKGRRMRRRKLNEFFFYSSSVSACVCVSGGRATCPIQLRNTAELSRFLSLAFCTNAATRHSISHTKMYGHPSSSSILILSVATSRWRCFFLCVSRLCLGLLLSHLAAEEKLITSSRTERKTILFNSGCWETCSLYAF